MRNLSLSLSLLAVSTVANAGAWNSANNPNWFNTSWHPTQYKYNFQYLPLKGRVADEHTPWADSYWPKNRGAMTYRWQEHQASGMSQDLTSAQRKAKFFDYKFYSKKELQNMSEAEINMLSPLEKYSIYIGDYNYSLVKKYRGKNSPDDLYWEGYCHAWAPAALHFDEPAPVVRKNADGIRVPFGSGDVKALLIANYADQFGFKVFGDRLDNRQIGQKCTSTFQYPVTKIKDGVEIMADYGDTDGLDDVELESYIYEYQTNARRVYSSKGTEWLQRNANQVLNPNLAKMVRQAANAPECEDTNAGAFHVTMANQLGLMKEGFLMDKNRDAEIWNQPVYGFESKIIGDEAPTAKAAAGTKFIKVLETKLMYADDTDYGWTFYFPTLTNLFKPEPKFMEEYLRYQDMLIREGDETEYSHYPDHVVDAATYRYKLELDASGKILGGEWITLDRPDFLWLMQKQGFEGSFKRLGEVYEAANLNH